MRVTKERLKFLKEYISASDTSTPLGDKLKIQVREGEVIYAQQSRDAFLITKISSDTKENFDLLVQTKMFWDFLSTLEDEVELVVTEKGIDLGEGKHYTFDSFDMSFPDVSALYEKVHNASQDPETTFFEFKDFDKLSVVQKFVGKDNTEAVGFMKNKLLGSDRVQIAYCDADIDLQNNYFFGRPAINLLLSQVGKQMVKVNLAKSFYFFTLNDTLCIFEWKQFIIPDLFAPQAFARFNQSDKVIVSKKDLSSVLNRMSFFVFNNPSFRIYISIKGDNLLIENRDFNKSYEKIPLIEKNPDLEDVTIIVSNKNLITFLSNLKGETISLFINKDSSSRVSLRIEDESSQFNFVHVLLTQDK